MALYFISALHVICNGKVQGIDRVSNGFVATTSGLCGTNGSTLSRDGVVRTHANVTCPKSEPDKFNILKTYPKPGQSQICKPIK